MADVPPWEEPGAVRRDCEPHRGPFLYHLASIGFVAAALSLICPLFAVISVPFLLVLRALAGRDLRLMDAGRMDPGGWKLTEGVRKAATRYLLIPVLGLVLWGGVVFTVVAIVRGARG
jgi:hypothetical protein